MRIGSQRPTSLHLPVDRQGSAGPEAVDLAKLAGLDLDEWQSWILREALSEASNGLWSADEVAVLVTRQNGKGSILEARQIAGLFLLHEALQVHTAHEFKTCFEHFLRVVSLIESTPELDRRVQRVRRGAGEQAVELKTGERLRFLARTSGSGRGLSGDTVYLDEAFALTPTIMGALLPTLSARENPQIWYMSSAPKVTSDVLHSVRRRGRAGNSRRLFFAEWAADPECDPSDRDAWYRSNPALGIRISEDSIEREFEAMREMPEEFARERLGIPDGCDGESGIVPVALWNELVEPFEMVGADGLALDVALDGRWSSICAAQVDADGVTHLDVVDRRPGTDWVVERAASLCQRFGLPLQVATTGPATAHVVALDRAGVTVTEVVAGDVQRAAESFVDAVKNKRLRHLGNVSMVNAIVGAAKKVTGDLWSLGRITSTADITPLIAATLALAAAAEGAYLGGFVDLDDLDEE